MGGMLITVQQHTLGSAKESKLVLDVGVSGGYSKSKGVAGLLTPDSATLVLLKEPVSCMIIDRSGGA